MALYKFCIVLYCIVCFSTANDVGVIITGCTEYTEYKLKGNFLNICEVLAVSVCDNWWSAVSCCRVEDSFALARNWLWTGCVCPVSDQTGQWVGSGLVACVLSAIRRASESALGWLRVSVSDQTGQWCGCVGQVQEKRNALDTMRQRERVEESGDQIRVSICRLL